MSPARACGLCATGDTGGCRAAAAAEALSRLRLPRAIVDHVCAYCTPSPFASFARRGRFEARVLAPLEEQR